MRQERWPDHALDPDVFVDASWFVRNSQLITVGHEEYLKRCLEEAEQRGAPTARNVAKQILDQEVGTSQHEPRKEIVAECNCVLLDAGPHAETEADDSGSVA
jgi:hypothetical protein